MRLTVEKIERAAEKMERTADSIDWVTGKVWRGAIAFLVLTLAIEDFRHALEHSPFLFSQDATWFFFFFGVLEAGAGVDILVRGPRSWILVRVA